MSTRVLRSQGSPVVDRRAHHVPRGGFPLVKPGKRCRGTARGDFPAPPGASPWPFPYQRPPWVAVLVPLAQGGMQRRGVHRLADTGWFRGPTTIADRLPDRASHRPEQGAASGMRQGELPRLPGGSLSGPCDSERGFRPGRVVHRLALPRVRHRFDRGIGPG